MRSDHRHLTAYQIGCEVAQSVGLVLRPAILDHDILALDVADFTNALPECGQKACTIGRRPRAAEESYHRHRRLLRPRRERPCSCSTKERDEFAAFHRPMPPCVNRNDSTTGGSAAVRDFNPAYVRFGSGADKASSGGPVRLYPRKADNIAELSICQLWHDQ